MYSRAEWTEPCSAFLAVVSGLGVSYNSTVLIEGMWQLSE